MLYVRTLNVSHIANLFVKEVVLLHSLPMSIVSDRDTQFISHFWRPLCSLLGTNLKFFTANHPQTDSQTKVVNHSLGNLLRCLMGDNPRKWDVNLPIVEFAYNSIGHCSIGLSPFQVVLRYQPRKPIDLHSIPHYLDHSTSAYTFT